MLEQILRELKNYFIREVWVGTFTISDGAIDLDFLQKDQYFRIAGSVFNDGVHKYPAEGLADETFSGEVWAMAVPPAVIALSEEIETWCEENKEALNSPFVSESFGGYSYSKGTGGASSGFSAPITWKEAFASRLNPWRKARYEFTIRRNDYLRDSE